MIDRVMVVVTMYRGKNHCAKYFAHKLPKKQGLIKKFFLDFSNGKGSVVIVGGVDIKEEVL